MALGLILESKCGAAKPSGESVSEVSSNVLDVSLYRSTMEL